ncbi:MAG: hypothetical protein CVU43_09715 [Chloroflexi bacterium HGW-Chloroflexi-5]|jgi:nitrogen regulatory protein PII|nr:MAG: hypothetical protein CVU43_09715 [Chloroflexi bacterium HGW-Chloroflexi-5]
MYMVMFVLHDPCFLKDVLEAWDAAGVSGVTIFPSTGLRRLQTLDVLREDIPLIPSLEDLIQQEERLNRTLFTIVDGDEMVDKVINATQSVIGDLNNPNTGILSVLPVVKTYGLNRKEEVDEDKG